MKIIPHLLRPARGGAAGVVIVFAVLLSLVAKGGLMGIPATLILTSWFFKYAYILFDHTVRGFDEPPPRLRSHVIWERNAPKLRSPRAIRALLWCIIAAQ
jgi:hypothetical protein